MTKQELEYKLKLETLKADFAIDLLKEVFRKNPRAFVEAIKELGLEDYAMSLKRNSKPLPKNTTQKPDATGPLQAPPPGGSRVK